MACAPAPEHSLGRPPDGGQALPQAARGRADMPLRKMIFSVHNKTRWLQSSQRNKSFWISDHAIRKYRK